MEFSVNKKDNYILVSLEGDLLGDSNGMSLMEIANNAIAQKKLNSIIDLEKVRYMNSSGIGVLVTLLSKYTSAGGTLVYIRPSDQIQKLLKITKLIDVFTIAVSEEEAVKLFKA